MLIAQRVSCISLSVLVALSLSVSTSWGCKKHGKAKNAAEQQSVQPSNPSVSDSDTMPHVYSAFSPAVLASSVEVTETQKAMVSQYIESQVAANDVTMQQFASMTPEQQRRVLTPGRQVLSRAERRTLQLQTRQASIPNNVQQAIIPLAVLEPSVIEKYGVALPGSVQTNLKVPVGISMVLFGNKLAALNTSGTVLSVVEEIY